MKTADGYLRPLRRLDLKKIEFRVGAPEKTRPCLVEWNTASASIHLQMMSRVVENKSNVLFASYDADVFVILCSLFDTKKAG